MSRLGLTFAGIDRARGRKQIEGPLATMAFADVYTSGYPRAQDLEVGEQSLNSLPYYCDRATARATSRDRRKRDPGKFHARPYLGRSRLPVFQ